MSTQTGKTVYGRPYCLQTGGMTLVTSEPWDAPDEPTARRWVDEVNARGGYAEMSMTYNGIGQCWYKVQLVRDIPEARS